MDNKENFTAVDKAIHNLKILIPFVEGYEEVIKNIKKECKELEKEQIKSAYISGIYSDSFDIRDEKEILEYIAEEYYSEIIWKI